MQAGVSTVGKKPVIVDAVVLFVLVVVVNIEPWRNWAVVKNPDIAVQVAPAKFRIAEVIPVIRTAVVASAVEIDEWMLGWPAHGLSSMLCNTS